MLSVVIQIEDFTARLAINSSAKHKRVMIGKGHGVFVVEVSFWFANFFRFCISSLKFLRLICSTNAAGRTWGSSSIPDEGWCIVGGTRIRSQHPHSWIREERVGQGDCIEVALQRCIGADAHLFDSFRSESFGIPNGTQSIGRCQAFEHCQSSVSVGISSNRKWRADSSAVSVLRDLFGWWWLSQYK